MKKHHIGILGKTLLFTCILVFTVSALIVSVFSSQFLRYAEEAKSIDRENQKVQLISDLQGKTPVNAIEFLKEYNENNQESLFVLLDKENNSILWKSEEVTATEVKQSGTEQSTILLISKNKSLDDLRSLALSLGENLLNSEKDRSLILKEFVTENPDVIVLGSSDSDGQLDFDIKLDENGKYILESTLSGWSSISSDSYERSERELELTDGNYRLLIKQKIDNQETTQLLAGILLKVLSVSILPALLGSFLFAKWMTNPIKRLAKETAKMKKREEIAYNKVSYDEIGDLTNDVRSLYEQLNQTIQELEKEMALVRQIENNQRNLFAAASHELKTPVAAISALLEGMLEEVGDYKDHPKYLRECLHITSSMKKLISELLEIVRLEENNVILQIEPIQLFGLLSEKLPLYETICEGQNLTLNITIPKNHTCMADRNRLSQVLDNVILNAIQNTAEGNCVKVWTEEKNDFLIFQVWNEGAVIPPEQIPNLFEPFYRLDKSRSRKDGHSGLGLAITKRLLNSMEIPFSLDNADGGVLFCIKLHK